ncbi:hypothetical protein MWU65_13590 [Cellulophaga sp. F20128]|uniref:hypothetical protein n=1 Tax=Cellulophaga sp. F20128 TaxID=2926413 RepID=UPI001FF4667B|nr:hypothetical protein [Cellulophaga sp. F20128]MCK0158222.1 hypothetical protein [Cellulophaga sp. F20128]
MKTIYLCILCACIQGTVFSQEITLSQLFEIVDCERDSYYDYSSCFVNIVKEHNFSRLDYDKGDDGYTGSKIGARKKHYGPKTTDTISKINSIYYLVFQAKNSALIYTDDVHYYNNLYKVVSSSNKFERIQSKEGSTEFKDWVFQPVGDPRYQINFIKHPDYKDGDYSIMLSKS